MIGAQWLTDPPPGWRVVPLRSLFQRRKVLGFVDEPMVSVFRDHGVVYKDSRGNLNKTAEDRSIYQLIDDGWLVVNRMKAWQGSVGVSAIRGIVSGHYICFQPAHRENSRYLNHLLRSPVYATMFGALSRGVRNGQIEIDNDDLGSLGVLLPPVEEQRRIAAFLDDQTTRIDRIMTARLHQRLLIPDWATGEYAEIVFAGDPPSVRLGSIADVRLGRQRSPANASGDFMCRYLRSANVLDGRVVLDDVNEMNFEPKERLVFSLRPGDLLVTEGAGSPEAVGASAMWDGREPGICFQNTLLRVRSRSEGYLPEYLGWWARTAHRSGAMRAYSSGASILHLGAEGLSRMEVPRRSRREQSAVIANCDRVESEEARTLGLLSQSVHLLQEFKRSLISAAVSGEFDVSAASGRGVPA